MKDFENAGTLRKRELNKALENLKWLKDKMEEAHSSENKDKNGDTRQIRIMGNIDFVMEKVKELKQKYGLRNKDINIYKNEKDKDDRCGDYSPKSLRAYVNVPKWA